MEICIRINSNTLSQRLGVEQTTKTYKRILRKKFLRSRKKIIRYGLLFGNFIILAGVIFIVTGSPSSGQSVEQNSIMGGAFAIISRLISLLIKSSNDKPKFGSLNIICKLSSMVDGVVISSGAADSTSCIILS